MQLGRAFDRTDLDELQLQAAERENAAAMSGEPLTVSLFDDHELHVEAHRRLLLQARFAYLKEKHPARARALEAHVLSHMAAMSPEKEVRADAPKNG
jgi:hypothetical protein